METIIQPLESFKIDQLCIEVYKNRTELGKSAARDVAIKIKELLKVKQQIRMVFAAAPSQNEFLAELVKIKGIEWERVTCFHMDEYLGLSKDSNQLFSTYLNNRLFSKVPVGKIHLIDSENEAIQECKRYGKLIAENQIDIICLGIGENGHLAFNDPPVANFQDSRIMKLVKLDMLCRQQQVNDGCFSSIEFVPTHALTLTIPTLFNATYLFCIVPGKTKAKALERTIKETVSEACPSTILRKHSNCKLYTDLDAYEKK